MAYDLLILGAGWTSTFLVPLLKESKVSYVATTRTGRDSTLPFEYDPDASKDQFAALPTAHTVLITFPLTSADQSKQVIDGYRSTRSGAHDTHFIQLGSTGIWQSPQTTSLWVTRASPYDTSNARAQAEDALMSYGNGVILNLAGLWGGSRQPRDFVDRLFKTKEQVRDKRSLHMVHGRDVARAILAVMQSWPGASRWMITDGFVYDWWALLAGWGSSAGSDTEKDHQGDVLKWVWQCMDEEDVRALPRSMESLGRCYDSREFWKTFKIEPVRARI